MGWMRRITVGLSVCYSQWVTLSHANGMGVSGYGRPWTVWPITQVIFNSSMYWFNSTLKQPVSKLSDNSYNRGHVCVFLNYCVPFADHWRTETWKISPISSRLARLRRRENLLVVLIHFRYLHSPPLFRKSIVAWPRQAHDALSLWFIIPLMTGINFWPRWTMTTTVGFAWVEHACVKFATFGRRWWGGRFNRVPVDLHQWSIG